MGTEHPSPGRKPPSSLEEVVLKAIGRALGKLMESSVEPMEGDPQLDRGRTVLNDSISFHHHQGLLIAQLALDPDLRSEITRKMVHVVGRVPAWMEARVYGVETMSSRLFALGTVQLMAEHRMALERIVDDQIESPKSIDEIEAILAESPVPLGADGETAEELFDAIGDVFNAHIQTMVAIARDFDEWMEGGGEDG